MTKKMTKKQINKIRDEINRWYDLMDDPSWDENTTAMWAMAEEIVCLRAELTTAQTMWMLEEAQKNKWKSLCEGIVEAITNEGREPSVHRRIIAKHRSEWMTLWERIDKAIKAVRNE